MTPDVNLIHPGVFLAPNVTIDQFDAVPQPIPPFGSATLRWSVTAPSDAQVTINSIPVPVQGQRTIQPPSTQSYTLIVTVGGLERARRTLTVTVNLAQCVFRENGIVSLMLTSLLPQIFAGDARFGFHQFAPSASVAGDKIDLFMRVKYDDGLTFPPLFADVRANFDLKVVPDPFVAFNRKIVPSNINIAVSAIPFLGFPDEAKEEELARKVRDGIPRLAEVAVLGFGTEPANMEPHNVSIGPGGFNNTGTVKTTYCPRNTIVTQ